MKKLYILIMVLFAFTANAQMFEPVTWSYSSRKISDTEAEVVIKATIERGWHVYSQFIEEGGPVPTSFRFNPSKDYTLTGKVSESPKAAVAFDKNFDMQIAWHKDEVTFRQRIRMKAPKTTVTGSLEFMVCNDERCLPPEEVEFSIPVNLGTAPAAAAPAVTPPSGSKEDASVPAAGTDTVSAAAVQPEPAVDSAATLQADSAQKVSPVSVPVSSAASDVSLWGILLAGFFGGLAAFFMPCIYPMIPLTVSFFTKKSGSRSAGIRHAFLYGVSIIVIYVSLGLLITFLFGSSALNEAASSATFNLVFFAILIVFAISFLGAFEITLPSGLVNKMDEKSNKGGFVGLFFMAFTLALVSFSCTGPIIGTLLVETVSRGTYLGPAMGMLGFSAALAIPFTLFAIFPSWLKEMPKSGGWLNTVKVSLGFLELALAFKFLSNVDLAYHWGIFDRDIFLVIWIIIFGILGFYLLGKISLSHDSPQNFLSLPRLFFAMLSLGFTLYMIPGLWGAPLKAISAWLPPQQTQDFDMSSSRGAAASAVTPGKKYAGLFHAPHGLDAFYDYEEGLAYARQVNKPVLIDFTGWSCTNCRKMEASVWSDPEVLRRLKDEYVLISLYVDDKTALPEGEQYTSSTGKKVRTIGQKWSDLQASRYRTNSQPYYVIVDAAGETLTPPQAFDLDINNYIQFLDRGKTAFFKK